MELDSDNTTSMKHTFESIIPKVDRFYIELTNACNFGCHFCPSTVSKRNPQNMDFSLFRKIVDEISNDGITNTVAFYLLGEPLLYPRIYDAIGYAKEKDLKVEITSNGSLLRDGSVEELVKRDLDILVISVVTINEKEHELRNSSISFRNYYQRVLDSIRTIRRLSAKLRIELRLLSTYTKRFFDVDREIAIGESKKRFKEDLSRFVTDLLEVLGKEVPDSKIRKLLRKINIHGEQILWLQEKTGIFIRPFVDWGNAFNSGVVHPCRVGYCGLAFTNMGVLSNGDSVICCGDYDGHTSLGSLRDNSITQLLGSEKAQNIAKAFRHFKILHPYCRRCLGSSNAAMSFVKGISSIFLFKIGSATKPRELYLN